MTIHHDLALGLNTGYGVRVDNGAGTTNVKIDSDLFLLGNTAGTSLFT